MNITGLKKQLFSGIFLRSAVRDFGGLTAYTKTNKLFTAYFQYKTGAYQKDYLLYFPKDPFTRLYVNEIFNKLYEHDGYDIIKYLEFHYAAYENKPNFLRFLRSQISDRVKNSWVLKLQSAHTWLEEKQQEYKSKQEARLREKIQSGVREIVIGQSAISLAEIDR